MYHDSFPKCRRKGSYEPVPFAHVVSEGAIPYKCSECRYICEGGCRRATWTNAVFLQLDYGPCRVKGPTEPVDGPEVKRTEYLLALNISSESGYLAAGHQVPKKCATCEYIMLDGNLHYKCAQDAHIWGDFARSLDWGQWQPPLPGFWQQLSLRIRHFVEQLR